jgi:hypothetical protein
MGLANWPPKLIVQLACLFSVEHCYVYSEVKDSLKGCLKDPG